MRQNRWFAAALVFTVALASSDINACGPFFPFSFLTEGDSVLLRAPRTVFHEELIRLNLVPPPYPHVPAAGGEAKQTAETDIAELGEALRRAGHTEEVIGETLEGYRERRRAIETFVRDHLAWERERDYATRFSSSPFKNPEPRLLLSRLPGSLPGEFSDYLEGAQAYYHGRFPQAEAAWTRLLRRPPDQRRYRSTWAAYMLGRMNWEDRPSDALLQFRTVRRLADEGFADSLGLAVTGMGWEARIRLRQGNHLQAIHLYLDQFAAGVASAEPSLRVTVLGALEADSGTLTDLAADHRARRVVTAYLLAGNADRPIDIDSRGKHAAIDLLSHSDYLRPRVLRWHRNAPAALLWLEALERAGVQDLAPAEELATAAYQAGQWELTQRWVSRAPESPICQWLQAKLYLRDGSLEKAAAALSPIVAQFPATPAFQHRQTRLGPLTRVGAGHPGANYLIGEYGVLQLARRQFTESLDALLRGGYWSDAAYVGERVLTLDELKIYVDTHTPAALEPTRTSLEDSQNALRHLLGRRLARAERYTEAAPYFPTALQPVLGEFTRLLGFGEAGSTVDQATSLFRAATLLRTNGLELVGTELAPDWFISGGNFDGGGPGPELRATWATTEHSGASQEELRRAADHHPRVQQRFHYRYLAAELAWQAAALLPDNEDRTAEILWTGGTWLKDRDPESADPFYKALVRRCRKTDLGAAADRRRWFPVAAMRDTE